MSIDDILHDLGIPPDYGRRPFRPRFDEARALTDIGCDVNRRPQKLAPQAAAQWRMMRRAAADDGVDLEVVSAFRSVAYQTALFRSQLAAGRPLDDLLKSVAAPGYSQHHTGMALDIAATGDDALDEDFERSAAFDWLSRRAETFGFFMPYPRENSFGFVYEPWHWAVRCPELDKMMESEDGEG